MIDSSKKKMSRWETLAVLITSVALSIVCLVLAFYKPSSDRVVITVDGKAYQTIYLSQVLNDYDIHIDAAYPVTLHVSREGVSFVNSQCPDKLCEGFGCVPRDCGSAVCLPAKVVVRSTDDEQPVH